MPAASNERIPESDEMCSFYDRYLKLGGGGRHQELDNFELKNPLKNLPRNRSDPEKDFDERRFVKQYDRAAAGKEFVASMIRTPLGLQVGIGHYLFES